MNNYKRSHILFYSDKAFKIHHFQVINHINKNLKQTIIYKILSNKVLGNTKL